MPDSGARYQAYWTHTESGVHRISRPIVVDGLMKPMVRIELRPRIKLVDGQLFDDSYRAVEHAAAQFYRSLTLPQLVMASVALQVHLRKHKEHIDRKKTLQARWTELARRMKRLRVEEEHLDLDDERHRERRRMAEAGWASSGERTVETIGAVAQLLELEAEELRQRRESWTSEHDQAQAAWGELEREDARLLESAPHFEKADDLKYPFVITLLAPRPEPQRTTRSTASAMHAVVEALQQPLSRTDQILLEIALRRCVRALAPEEDGLDAAAWERDLVRRAESEFTTEFLWSRPYTSEAVRTR